MKIREFISVFRQAIRNDVTTSRELYELLRNGQSETESGAVVSPDTAMRISAFYACLRVLAESLAQVPCILYRKTPTGKEKAEDHSLFHLLHESPNGFQTAFDFFELMQIFLGVRGNAYALKTVVRGELRELLPISPDRVTVRQQPDWSVIYDVSMPDGSIVPTPPERMFHVPGLGFDGVRGLSPLLYHKETLGVAIQLTRHTARIFKNGAHIGGVLEHPQRLSPEAYQRLRESFDEKYAGVSNAHKTLLLEEGTKFNGTGGMNSKDAQYIETRKFTRSEIASIFRVPPHMIGDLERATFSNIEQQALEFVLYTMTPWFRRFEQRIAMQLLTNKEKPDYFVRFRINDLLRGDMKTRFSSYNLGILSGWLSRNEVRDMEDMNKEDGLDEFLTPVNMQDPNNPDNTSTNNPPDKGAKP